MATKRSVKKSAEKPARGAKKQASPPKPKAKGTAEGQLSDKDLDRVAGGIIRRRLDP